MSEEKNYGLGVMIGMIFGDNNETAKAIKSCIGRKINDLQIIDDNLMIFLIFKTSSSF